MKKELVSQYNAALHMLENIMGLCPEELWDDGTNYENTFWRILYHTLFYTDLYLAENADGFAQWEKHESDYNRLGVVNDDKVPIVITFSYSKSELSEYLQSIRDRLDGRIGDGNLSAVSGFYWLKMNKLELYLYNLRHIQHHTGQLVERLHGVGVTGVAWY